MNTVLVTGAIYGPGPVAKRALARTSFNRVLQAGLQGKLTRYLRFLVTWVYCEDVARGSIAALVGIAKNERGDPAQRSTDTPTSRRLGCRPTSLDDGLVALVDWLRELGRID